MSKVLIVDDEDVVRATIREILTTLMEDDQFQAIEAGSGPEAFNILQGHEIDCVVLDVNLPGMDGFQVCQRLKSDPKFKHIPVVFLTGHALDLSSRIQGLSLGADDFIAKPASPSELVLRVRNLLRTKAAEDALRKKSRELEKLLRNEESELQRTRAEYLEFLEGATDLISAIDSQGYFFYINGLHENLLGYPLPVFQEKPVYEFLPKDQQPAFRETLDKLKKTGSSPLVQFDLITKDNDRLPVEIQFSRIIDDANNLMGFRIVARDIRQRRALELELKDRIEQLEKINDYKTKFLAGMSHEFFTPLMAVLNYIRFVLNDTDPPPHQNHVADLKRALEAAEYLEELINTVLDLAHIESGKLPIQEEKVQAIELISLAISTVREQLRQKGLWLKQDFPVVVPELTSDGLRIKQILINLLSNACRYTDEGGITIRIPPDPDSLRVEVEDTGIGISAERLTNLFQEFAQVHDKASRRGGRGLGLSISRKLARLLGGDIEVRSRLGKGSVFVLKLPFHRSAVPHTVIPPNRWILLYDPDPWACEVLKRKLLDEGYSVVDVREGDEALRIMDAHCPAAIIWDVQDPSCYRQMKERHDKSEQLSRVPVLTLSKDSSNSTSWVVGSHFIKPADPSELIHRISGSWVLQGLSSQKGIVIVEDSVSFRSFLRDMFAQVGCSPFLCVNGKEALRVAKEQEVGLYILDLMLPDLDGFKLVEHLQTMPLSKDVPILILTNRVLSHVERQWLLERTNGVLKKETNELGLLLLEMMKRDRGQACNP